MSITQTYYLAHTARGKLSSEAGRSDHNLRLLVGHANLLDSLMLELAAAEDEQEQWFHQSVTKASSKTKGRTHIQWADAVVEDPAEDWHIEDAEAESDSESSTYGSDDEDVETGERFTPLQRVHSFSSRSPSPSSSDDACATVEEVEQEFEDDGEEDLEGLQLRLTPSRSQQQTPELDPDSDDAASSSEEDESMPPSPPSAALPTFSEKQRIVTTSYYRSSSRRRRQPTPRAIPQPEPPRAFFEYSPRRAPKPGLVSAIRVY
ncbi:uncharacterized protein L3040_004450 [Drepanopeziza brunnea f. sp. 'multigermtubi']|nr:hypothetical protein L3040_004450 [Drepanopeziza brunnea f. sp. 'multigermtubi']